MSEDGLDDLATYIVTVYILYDLQSATCNLQSATCNLQPATLKGDHLHGPSRFP
jgi:hypothetical protein